MKNNSTNAKMSKRVCAARCLIEIKDDDLVLKCSNVSCNHIYHEGCTDAGKRIRGLAKYIGELKTLQFKCSLCIEKEKPLLAAMNDITIEVKKRDELLRESNKLMHQKIENLEKLMEKHYESTLDEIITTQAKIESICPSNAHEKSDWSNVVKKNPNQKRMKEHVVIIRPNGDEMKRSDVKQALRSSIDASLINSNGISPISSNGIAVRCSDEESQKKLIENLANVESINAAEPKRSNPRVKILRVDTPETKDEDFINRLKKQNDELKLENCIILKRENVMRFGKRVDERFNIVMEIAKSDYDILMDNKKIRHQFQIYNVVDNIYIRRCFKCFGYNHIAKDCKNERACPKCSKNHEREAKCESSEVKCVNCINQNKRLNLNLNVNHEVWSKECETYKQKLARSKLVLQRSR